MTFLCPVKQPRRRSAEKKSDGDGNAANGTGEESDPSFPDAAVEATSEYFFATPPPRNDKVVADAEAAWTQDNPPPPLRVPPLAQHQYLPSNRNEKTGDFQGQHVLRLRHNHMGYQHPHDYRRTLMQQHRHQDHQHQQQRQHDPRHDDFNDHGSPIRTTAENHRRPSVIGGQKGPDTPHPIVVGDQKGPGPRLGCMWNLSPIVQRARKGFGLTCRSNNSLQEGQGRNIVPLASPFQREATHYDPGEDEDDDEEDEDYICDNNSDDYNMEVEASSSSSDGDDYAFNNVDADEIFEEVIDLVADNQNPGRIIVRAKRDRDSWNNSEDDVDEHEGGPEMGTNSIHRGIRKSLLDLEKCLSAAIAWENLKVKKKPEGHHINRHGRGNGRKLPKSERTIQESTSSWKHGSHLEATVMNLLDDIHSVIFEDPSAKKFKVRVFKALVVSAKLFRDNKEILVKVMYVLETAKDGMPLLPLVSVVLYLLRQEGTVIRLQELSMNILQTFAEECGNRFYDEHLHHRYDLFQVFCRLGGIEVLLQSLQTMQTGCNHLDKDNFAVLLYFHRMALNYVDMIGEKVEKHQHGDGNEIGPNGLVKEAAEEPSKVDVTFIHSKLTIARVEEYFKTHSAYMSYLTEE